MSDVINHLRFKLPFMVAGFASMLFSLYLYFIADETTAAIFVGIWVPSIHSLGTLMLSNDPASTADAERSTRIRDEVAS